ncbi:hypothetical protein D3C75_686010 [compost metagenome]
MNGLRQNLFAGATLPVNQHTDVRLRDHPRLLQQTQHNGASCDDGIAPHVVPGDDRVHQRIVNGFIKRVFIDRLSQEAKHALLRCRDGVRYRAVSGQNDHRHARIHFLDFSEQRHTVHFVHPQITDHQVDFFTTKQTQPFGTAFGSRDGVTFAGQAHTEKFQQARIVIDQQ